MNFEPFPENSGQVVLNFKKITTKTSTDNTKGPKVLYCYKFR